MYSTQQRSVSHFFFFLATMVNMSTLLTNEVKTNKTGMLTVIFEML